MDQVFITESRMVMRFLMQTKADSAAPKASTVVVRLPILLLFIFFSFRRRELPGNGRQILSWMLPPVHSPQLRLIPSSPHQHISSLPAAGRSQIFSFATAVDDSDFQPSSRCVFSPLTLQTFSFWTLPQTTLVFFFLDFFFLWPFAMDSFCCKFDCSFNKLKAWEFCEWAWFALLSLSLPLSVSWTNSPLIFAKKHSCKKKKKKAASCFGPSQTGHVVRSCSQTRNVTPFQFNLFLVH